RRPRQADPGVPQLGQERGRGDAGGRRRDHARDPLPAWAAHEHVEQPRAARSPDHDRGPRQRPGGAGGPPRGSGQAVRDDEAQGQRPGPAPGRQDRRRSWWHGLVCARRAGGRVPGSLGRRQVAGRGEIGPVTGETVLIAEDDAGIRTVLARALSRQGYRVQATSVASALWRWIADGDGDVVITDVALPDENSLDLLPRIKSFRPDLPIIVMSAQNTLLTAVRA